MSLDKGIYQNIPFSSIYMYNIMSTIIHQARIRILCSILGHTEMTSHLCHNKHGVVSLEAVILCIYCYMWLHL